MADELDPDVIFTSPDEKTFQCDEDLPSLPVPTLQDTLKRYLDSVRPHLSDDEYSQTEFIVQQFGSGISKQLQEKLLKRAASSRNWLDKWWLEYAYMDFRLPVAPLVNFGGPGPYMSSVFPPQEGSWLERAGVILHAKMKNWNHIRMERLRPDKDSKGNHLSMSQFRRAYSTCRIPANQRDHLKSYFKTVSEGNSPKNFVVFCKGRIFTMDAVDENYEPLTAPELQQQFQYIKDQCDKLGPGPGVGALTGDNRTSWAEMRNRLIALNPRNFDNLEEIQKSIIAVSLEDYSPADENDLFLQALAGDSTNKWFDKSCCLIFFRNGLVASNCDHSPYDAMVLVTNTYYVDLCVKKCKGKWEGSTEIRKLAPPRELVFVLDDVLYRGIDNAKQVYDSHANNLTVSVRELSKYGKSFLRKNKLHPDTHVQLALQYAYYKTYKKPAPTYETGTTRRYYNARTETVRSCTSEAVEWSKAMLNNDISVENKLLLYKVAADKHNRLMAEATNNQGCDRHLFGLQILAAESGIPTPQIFTDPAYTKCQCVVMGCDRHLFGLQILAAESGIPTPQIFTDPAYTKSGGGGNFVLSTSFVGYTSVFGGVAPMVENGYGCFYRIESKHINIFVSAWKSSGQTDARKFSQTVIDCLHEMGDLIEQGTARHAKL